MTNNLTDQLETSALEGDGAQMLQDPAADYRKRREHVILASQQRLNQHLGNLHYRAGLTKAQRIDPRHAQLAQMHNRMCPDRWPKIGQGERFKIRSIELVVLDVTRKDIIMYVVDKAVRKRTADLFLTGQVCYVRGYPLRIRIVNERKGTLTLKPMFDPHKRYLCKHIEPSADELEQYKLTGPDEVLSEKKVSEVDDNQTDRAADDSGADAPVADTPDP